VPCAGEPIAPTLTTLVYAGIGASGPQRPARYQQDPTDILTKQKLQELIRQVAPNDRLEPEVEEVPPQRLSFLFSSLLFFSVLARCPYSTPQRCGFTAAAGHRRGFCRERDHLCLLTGQTAEGTQSPPPFHSSRSRGLMRHVVCVVCRVSCAVCRVFTSPFPPAANQSDCLDAKDVALHLERNWNLQIPGNLSPARTRVSHSVLTPLVCRALQVTRPSWT
jgi:hypothetical protein